MRKGLAVAVAGLFACTPAGSASVDNKPPVSPTQPAPDAKVEPPADPVPDPAQDPVEEPVQDPKASTVAVHMTSATLADDCGGGPNTPPPPPRKRMSKRAPSAVKGDRKAKAKRRCEQSSIQLAITAPADTEPVDLSVKSVELRLASGSLVGKLQARAPSVWSEADGYTPWDEKVNPAQELSVTYALSRPDWSAVEDRWNKTYTVKAVITIAGADQTVEHNVTVNAPTSLPPNVKT